MREEGHGMQLPYSEKLNIEILGRIFDNKSECYKLFWFQAIMSGVEREKNEFTYEELIDEMIADAWYMVTEYHLNLGPNDTLEKAVNRVSEISGLITAEKKEKVLEYLKNCDDRQVHEYKRSLTLNVPYRLQAPFLNFKTGDWGGTPRDLSDRINQQERLMYYFIAINGLDSRIRISDDWMEYLSHNHEIINGWIRYNTITYLQRRNPNVPGISDKIDPPHERNLEKVKKYWKLVTEISPVKEIYGSEIMTPSNISIDHFVPWSYVAHDEFWNLHPTTRSINSSKSNNLPNWDHYFPLLAELEYKSYSLMWQNEAVHKEFDKCAREHVNSAQVQNRLYREGLSKQEFEGELKEIILPVYSAARNCGFKDWEYSNDRI